MVWYGMVWYGMVWETISVTYSSSYNSLKLNFIHRIASLPPADRNPPTPTKEETDSLLPRPRSILTSLVNVTLNDDVKAETAMVISDYTARDDSKLTIMVWYGMIWYGMV